MKRILVTGMSGTGKSSVIIALIELGHRAVDLDTPEFSIHAPDGEWVWRESVVDALLRGHGSGPLFVSGCASNQTTFYPLFDHIVLLSAPTDTILTRLRDRTNNDYGKTSAQVAEVVHNIAMIEPLLREGATYELDAGEPLADVVGKIVALARGA